MSSKKSGKGSKTKKSGKPQFQDKEYDVSMNGCCLLVLAISSCGFSLCTAPYDSKLLLGSEEVTKTDVSLCGKSQSKSPYGELGHVGQENQCGCCASFSSSFGIVSPGCGCETALVDAIVEDLKARQAGRGDQGQIERQEAAMEAIEEVNVKLDKIMAHLKMERD